MGSKKKEQILWMELNFHTYADIKDGSNLSVFMIVPSQALHRIGAGEYRRWPVSPEE